MRERVAVARIVALLGLAACGEAAVEEPFAIAVPNDPFCAEALPQVQAWMDAQRAAHPVPDDPRYGGTVVVGAAVELAGGMNALVSTEYTATQHQQFVNLTTLIDYDDDYGPRPYLAESWEISPDGRALTFRLRDDVFWHDGVRTTASDVAFTFVRATDPATAFPNAAFWDHYVKGPEGVTVVDERTVTLRLEPHAELLDPWRTLAILPEHLLGDVPPEDLGTHPYNTVCPIGNGPFVFTEHRPQETWTFTANPGFPEGLGGRPKLDRYVYRIIPEQTTLLAELLTEGIDVYIAPSPQQAEQIAADPDLELRSYPFRDVVFVVWNARRPQLADARVRRALTMGTNRAEIVAAVLEGYATVANSGVPPFHWAWSAEVAGLGYDPEGAGALLEEAGWRDRDGDGIREDASGRPLSISLEYPGTNQRRKSISEIMQAQLAEIGIEVRPRGAEATTLLARMNAPDQRDFDGVVMGWVTEFKLDDMDLFHSERADQPYAWSGTKNATIDDLLERLSATPGREAAIPLWREYQAAIQEEQPYTFFYYPDRLDGISRRLREVKTDIRGEWINIKDWWIDPTAR